MTGEPMHTASKERNGAMHPNYINYHLKIHYSSVLIHYKIKNCSKSTPAIHAYQKREMAPRATVTPIIVWK